MVQAGDTVFVSEYSDTTRETTTSVALVTYVYTEDDGDSKWWEAAGDKQIVDAYVFPRGGVPRAVTVGKSETVQVDDGEGGVTEIQVGYSTSPDGADDAPEDVTPETTPDQASVIAATSGATTDTVGDGTAPQGSATNPDGSPVQPNSTPANGGFTNGG